MRRRKATKIEWCLTHESKRHQTFTEFCDHGYTLWYYKDLEVITWPVGKAEKRVSHCRFAKARLEVFE